MKFALGTAQLGMRYGIANSSGQLGQGEISHLLTYALESGVDVIDTAMSYGDSESRLGCAGVGDFNVITKLPTNIDDGIDRWLSRELTASLNRLRIPKLSGVLLHGSQQILGVNGALVASALAELRQVGIVDKIGVSVYDPGELESILKICPLDLVQLPLNAFDQRAIDTGWLDRLYHLGVEVHARSVFLQGLLLLPRSKIPEKFSRWSYLFDRWHEWRSSSNQTAIQACLSFVNDPRIDRVVIGVDSLEQLKEILSSTILETDHDRLNFACSDLKLLHPFNWDAL